MEQHKKTEKEIKSNNSKSTKHSSEDDEYEYEEVSLFEDFQEWGKRSSPAIVMATLVLIGLLAFLIRIFSVIRYEAVIHEFDPWFNYRTTQYITNEGVYAFWNWFDPDAWYPLGRVIGGTTYPGLMFTSSIIHWLSGIFLFPIDIRYICVFLAPAFASLTALITYFFTKEVTGRSDAGLLSALFIAIVPGYISRSVAGSYDNEAVAIFALLATFYFYVKSVNQGSIFWASVSSLMYLYMVAAWGGYVFIINLIPLYNLFLIVIGRFEYKIYVSYTVFYILGTILSMQIPFVMFNAIETSEHMLSHGVFILIQATMFINFVKSHLQEDQFKKLYQTLLLGLVILFALMCIILHFLGIITFSSRTLTLLDPTYAKKFIPIVASVSEHQPTTWSSFFFDLHLLLAWAPLGFYYCYFKPSNSRLFVAIFGIASVYFSCVMVRLLLLSSPALCLLSGIGLSDLLRFLVTQVKNYKEESSDDDEEEAAALRKNQSQVNQKDLKDKKENKKEPVNNQQKTLEEEKYSGDKLSYNLNDTQSTAKQSSSDFRMSGQLVLIFLLVLSTTLVSFVLHSVWVGAEAYASPSIILANKDRYGNKHIIDDFREAYYWMRMNTKEDSKIVSWWDYGYQIAGMSNRAVIVDNNTWNTTHIATVGATFTNEEEESFRICKMLDANYVLVIFGGYSAYSGDDINKFIWIVRITSGYYPRTKEENYIGPKGYKTDASATETMLESMMYKFSYYRFDEAKPSRSQQEGYDLVRGYVIGKKNIKLRHFSEAYTTDNWIVRIYSVNDYPNREIPIKSRNKKRIFIKETEEAKERMKKPEL